MVRTTMLINIIWKEWATTKLLEKSTKMLRVTDEAYGLTSGYPSVTMVVVT